MRVLTDSRRDLRMCYTARMLRTAMQDEMDQLKRELDGIVAAYLARMQAIGRKQDDALRQFAHELERLEVERIKEKIGKQV